MAHPEEVLAAVLATWASASTRRGTVVPWSVLETRLSTDLTGRSSARTRARFVEDDDAEPATPEAWLASLAREGATELALLEVPADERPRSPGLAVEAHRLHAFTGSGGVVLAARAGPAWRRWRTRSWMPPPTTLAVSDVLAFVAERPSAGDLRDALLWQDAHNLHVTDGADWGRFVAALRPGHAGVLVQAMDRVVGNVRFTGGEAQAWYALERQRRNPGYAWQVAFVRAADAGAAPLRRPVAAQAARLRGALVEIEAFARRIEQAPWADAFAAARAILDGDGVPPPLRAWFDGAGMAEDALRLLAAAVRSDVFGGMASWNDLAPADGEGYARVSAALFAELQPSLLCAVNATTSGR